MALPTKPMLLANDIGSVLPLAELVGPLNARCKSLCFAAHPTPIDLGSPPISNPRTYKAIKGITGPLLKTHSSLIIATDLQYDNNYFWDSDTSTVITSFAGWGHLTNLTRTNGLLGFLLSILAEDVQENAPRHDENTGCVYDFLWDKSGIDMRLRGGAMCRDCLARIQQQLKKNGTRQMRMFNCSVAEGFADMLQLMDAVSTASKRELDILRHWEINATVSDGFDVFLCHNSKDKSSVRTLYGQLVGKGVRPWFDEEHLAPGTAWQDELQATIPRIRTVAVIVGPNGKGPWQDMELRAFLSEFANRGCRVIPVILADAPSVPDLPLFLQQFTWVDFRRGDPPPLDRLLWGITGSKPK